MYNQPMAQLDPATQALAQAVSLLKQRANPMTQNGLPTIAAQVMQAAQPQQSQGLPDILSNARQAAPSVQQNAQEGQMNQMAQQVAQHMQKQQQPPGVSGLPANNMGFAEGGIIPYADGGLTLGSMPPDDAEAVKRMGMSIYDSPEERARKIVQAKILAALEASPKAEIPKEDPEVVRARIEAGYMDRNRPSNLAGIMATAPAPQQTPRPAAPRAATSARANQPTMPSTQYGQGFDPGAGITSGMFAPAPSATSPEIEAAQARLANIDRLNKERPDYYKQNLAALDADKQARMGAMKAQQDRQGFDALMAMFQGAAKGGMGGMGEATTAFNKNITTQKDAARQADLLDAQMRVKLGELDHARKIGDETAAIAVQKDIAGIRHQMDQIAAIREGHKVQTRGQDITSNTADLDRASRERIAAAENAARLAAAKLGAENKGKAADLREFALTLTNTGIKKRMEDAQAMLKASPVKGRVMLEAARKDYNALAAKHGLSELEASAVLQEMGGTTTAPASSAAGWGQMSVK